VQAGRVGLTARGPTRMRKFTVLAELRGGWPIELGTTKYARVGVKLAYPTFDLN
jgi:hypothetical protein